MVSVVVVAPRIKIQEFIVFKGLSSYVHLVVLLVSVVLVQGPGQC